MVKTIGKVTYDTEASSIVKKITSGCFGDTEGYEETLYVTEKGNYFIYTNGGENSIYPTENIKRMSKKAADEWLANN